MAADVLKFVDAISASPTTRLDMTEDGGSGWRLTSFVANPPRLRRAASNNAMRDGGIVSSSSYENRVLTITFSLVNAAQDTNATEIQKLARELDRETNLLKWQPNGLTKPVFFKTFRSDVTTLDYLWSAKAFHNITIEVLAEPFALGLLQTVGPYTVTNDPAAASRGHYFDIAAADAIGDVPADIVIKNATAAPCGLVLATRQHGTPSDLTFFMQAESLTNSTDTTNPGGAADAVMSGTALTNYKRTTFATDATMTIRVRDWSPRDADYTDAEGIAIRGTYRVMAAVRRSDATSVINVRWSRESTTETGETVALPLTTDRQLVDLGLISFGMDLPTKPGGAAVGETPVWIDNPVHFEAQRVSGAGTLDWDYFVLVPADEAQLRWESSNSTTDSTYDLIIDGALEAVYYMYASTDPFDGTAVLYSGAGQGILSGGFPKLLPNQINRFYLYLFNTPAVAGTFELQKSDTAAITLYYYPRYLFIRPSAT